MEQVKTEDSNTEQAFLKAKAFTRPQCSPGSRGVKMVGFARQAGSGLGRLQMNTIGISC